MKDSNSEPLNNSVPYNHRGNGVVYTPLPVAQVVVAQALAKLDLSTKRSTLEPSCGDGSFLRALVSQPQLDVYALDKDRGAITQCRSKFSDTILFQGDFFEELPADWPELFDLIIGNPPYIGWHRCDKGTRESLDELCVEYNYQSRHLKNSWAGFVVKATMKLSAHGVLAFVIPYEFLTVSYGKRLREWMEAQFSSIDIFVPDEKAFKSIDQDAVTVIAVKGDWPCETTIHRVSSLAAETAQSSREVSPGTSMGSSLAMKGFLLEASALNLIHKLEEKCNRISDFCDSAAGTVTAANDYFILSHADVALHKLKHWVRPIIKKSSFLGDTVDFSRKSFEEIRDSGKACYLLDFNKLDADRLPKEVERYVVIGEDQGLHLRYKCRHRTVWFKVPVVAENEGLFFKRSHVLPRFCINSFGVLATDSAYHVRMKPEQSVQSLCGSFYNSLTLLFSEIEGRFYGGGVLELTPNEFRGLPIFLNVFSDEDFAEFQQRFSLLDSGWSAMQFSNAHLKKSLGLSQNEIELIETARHILQRHRLRHGGTSRR